jgi:hypothetical protein
LARTGWHFTQRGNLLAGTFEVKVQRPLGPLGFGADPVTVEAPLLVYDRDRTFELLVGPVAAGPLVERLGAEPKVYLEARWEEREGGQVLKVVGPGAGGW